MKHKLTLLITTFILSIGLQFGATKLEAYAQQENPFIHSIPACELDIRFIVETLADYDLEHQSQISGGQFWGMTDYQFRTVYISNAPDATIRKQVVMHELCHIFYHTKGLDEPKELLEQSIRIQVPEMYQRLWGGK